MEDPVLEAALACIARRRLSGEITQAQADELEAACRRGEPVILETAAIDDTDAPFAQTGTYIKP